MNRLVVLSIWPCVLMCGGASVAQAQQCEYPSGNKEISTNGSPGSSVQVNATFYYVGNTNCTLRVQVYLEGLSADQKECTGGSGSIMTGGKCQKTTDNASVSAEQRSKSSVADLMWGTWVGKADYITFIQPGGTQVDNGTKSETVSLGPRPKTPQEECEGPPPVGDWYNDMCNYYSPILIPTTRGGRYRLTSPEHGVLFDMNGDGILEQISWTEADSDLAFLALSLIHI